MIVHQVLPEAVAFRPRLNAASIKVRYGSHALADGARSGDGSAPTDRAESVDTSGGELAGFAVRSPGRPRPRAVTPTARSYALTISRRTPVADSMRRSGHPSRPCATICCCLSGCKTLPILPKDHTSFVDVNVSIASRNGRFSGVH